MTDWQLTEISGTFWLRPYAHGHTKRTNRLYQLPKLIWEQENQKKKKKYNARQNRERSANVTSSFFLGPTFWTDLSHLGKLQK